jgi:hypothetical protein
MIPETLAKQPDTPQRDEHRRGQTIEYPAQQNRTVTLKPMVELTDAAERELARNSHSAPQ